MENWTLATWAITHIDFKLHLGGVRCGIGLSSVRETVERHGGTMDLYPGEDVFQVGITLPIHNR